MEEKELIKSNFGSEIKIKPIQSSGISEDFFISPIQDNNILSENILEYPSISKINSGIYHVGNSNNEIDINSKSKNNIKSDNLISNTSDKDAPTISKNNYMNCDNIGVNYNYIDDKIGENEFKNKLKDNNRILEFEAPFYQIVEKCDVKDLIGFHKQYEVLFYPSKDESKQIKCYRRYDNFDKFNLKIRRKFPYIIIPKLTQKNRLGKLIRPDEDFFYKRCKQLNFYLNFLLKNEFISKTKEFIKFTNDAEFDEEYFTINKEDEYYYFPESAKISETLTKKLFGVFTSFFNSRDDRKISNNEILLNKMNTHYKGLLEKYREIQINIVNYLRTLKINSEGYKHLSSTCHYMKDSLSLSSNKNDSKENFQIFHEICEDIAEINKMNFDFTGLSLEYRFQSFISILSGLCDAFDRYGEYNKIYDYVLKSHKEARSNGLENLSLVEIELNICGSFKFQFDENLMKEVQIFSEEYKNTFDNLFEEFKLLLKSVNSQEFDKLNVLNNI